MEETNWRFKLADRYLGQGKCYVVQTIIVCVICICINALCIYCLDRSLFVSWNTHFLQRGIRRYLHQVNLDGHV